MLDIKELSKAVRQVAEEKGLAPEVIIEAIESSIAAAYKRDYADRGGVIKCKLDEKAGALTFWQVKTVVDETTVRFVDESTEEEVEKRNEQEEEQKLPRFNPERHITLEDARKIKPSAEVGDELPSRLKPKRILEGSLRRPRSRSSLQKLRESERESILAEWMGKAGQIASGEVQRFDRGNVFINLGRAIGVMFANESIPNEHYRAGERLRFLVLAVQEDTRMPGIILSRANPQFVAELFKVEVPELAEGAIEIKGIAREPGNRAKIAVGSNTEGVDPVGALVGQRGTRVMAVNNELGNEKIDIIEWSDDPENFIANALSPAKVEKCRILPRREARAFVPESQLSLAMDGAARMSDLRQNLPAGRSMCVRNRTPTRSRRRHGSGRIRRAPRKQ